jgi:hypothetical protein
MKQVELWIPYTRTKIKNCTIRRVQYIQIYPKFTQLKYLFLLNFIKLFKIQWRKSSIENSSTIWTGWKEERKIYGATNAALQEHVTLSGDDGGASDWDYVAW